MARQGQVSEFNTFVKGLYTEASPLTYPEGTAIDIDNFVLSRDGSLSRRDGIDLEPDYVKVATGVSTSDTDVVIKSYIWDNVSGDARLKYLVVQVGNVLTFFDTTKDVISDSKVASYVVDDSDGTEGFSFSQVDGTLVVAVGSPDLLAFERDFLLGVKPTTFRIKIRDVFGVQDGETGFYDWRSPENVSKRQRGGAEPSTQLLYNLRNMSWSPFRYSEVTLLADAIQIFRNGFQADVWPSYADNVNSALFADANNSEDRNTERFVAKNLIANPSGNFEAPNGYFIIDLFDRGASRYEEISSLDESQGTYTYKPQVGVLPTDRTPGGVNVVASYAGRMWYAGFSGEVIGGDRHSPKLSSYIMYSQLVEDQSDLGSCHQKGDPTSRDFSELLDTDGGFIRIDEAYGIKSLVPVGDNLVILAENGVWAVLGGSGYGFTATDYKVVKVSNQGAISSGSVVVVDNTVLYWSKEAIYQVSPNQFGDLEAEDLSSNVIGSEYESIPTSSKVNCSAMYDSFERKVMWLFNVGNASKEIVIDLSLGAFYKNTINNTVASLQGLFESPPFKSVVDTSQVVSGSDVVLVGTDNVVVSSESMLDAASETSYLVIFSDGSEYEISVAKKYNKQFKDWFSIDEVGSDAYAYLITGYISGGDYQRNKQVPYVTFHFDRTEDGFEEVDGDIVPTNQSSCKVQAQWECANSATSGRWGREFQAYRYKRYYIPESVDSPYDYGFSTITTKNKIRGKGKVISFLIKTEEGKDCRLLGWSMLSDVATRV